jgi:hypothetical protein
VRDAVGQPIAGQGPPHTDGKRFHVTEHARAVARFNETKAALVVPLHERAGQSKFCLGNPPRSAYVSHAGLLRYE